MTDAPVELYIAAYSDPTAAEANWEAITQLARDDVITLNSLTLVSRDNDGTIHLKHDAGDLGKEATIGAIGGAIIGLIFPPSILAAAAVGAGLGAGSGAIVDHEHKREIKTDVENALPRGSTGIVALFDRRWVKDVDAALRNADTITKHRVDLFP
jgi:uncharacterized membrane protein